MVVAIVSLLIGIVIPSLAEAKRRARIAGCGVNLRQIHAAIGAYAADGRDELPRGPDLPIVFLPTSRWSEVGHKLIWVPYFGGSIGVSSPGEPNALGVLVRHQYFDNPKLLFCPADLVNNPESNLAAFVNRDPNTQAYCSYMYRQLDQVNGTRLASLGSNGAGLAATALAFDQVVEGFAGEWIDNHSRREVNCAYLDGHVTFVSSCGDSIVFRAADGPDPYNLPQIFAGLEWRMNQILVNLDYAPLGNPMQAPQIP